MSWNETEKVHEIICDEYINRDRGEVMGLQLKLAM